MQTSKPWRMSPSAFLLLAAITIFGISSVNAQTDLPTITASTDNAIPTASSPKATATASSKASSGDTATSASDSKSASNSASLPRLSDASSATTTGTTKELPAISTPSGLPQIPTGLPTLPGGYNYPAPTVPPTANAPYMHKSNLPQDTVFIAVGAGLAFIAAVILGWRLLVAWSINRSVRHAATAGYSSIDSNSHRRKSALEPYSHAPMGSTMSLEKLAGGSRSTTAMSKGPTPNASLFFSPTAGAGMHTPASNRNSAYLPSGYYSAGAAVPGGGASMTTVGGPGDRNSKLRPYSGQLVTTRSLGPSPPDSPTLKPLTGGLSTADSRSSLNLSAATVGHRAPSIYLDDLMSSNVSSVPQQANDTRTRPGQRRHSRGNSGRIYRD